MPPNSHTFKANEWKIDWANTWSAVMQLHCSVCHTWGSLVKECLCRFGGVCMYVWCVCVCMSVSVCVFLGRTKMHFMFARLRRKKYVRITRLSEDSVFLPEWGFGADLFLFLKKNTKPSWVKNRTTEDEWNFWIWIELCEIRLYLLNFWIEVKVYLCHSLIDWWQFCED